MGRKHNSKDDIKTNNNKKVKAQSKYTTKNSQQRRRLKSEHQQKIKNQQMKQALIQEQNYQQETIQSLLIHWLNAINQKDLVFTEKTRQKLRLDYPQKLIQKSHQYKVEQQLLKIKNVIKSIKILQNIDNQEQSGLDDKRRTNMKLKFEEQLQKIFLNASALFPKDVTPQLYHILQKTTIIVLENHQDYKQMVRKLSKLGNELANPQSEEKDYFYFSFKMFKLPSGRNEHEIQKLAKHYPHYRYILKEQYRQQNGPYAQLIREIGELLYSKYNQILLIEQKHNQDYDKFSNFK